MNVVMAFKRSTLEGHEQEERRAFNIEVQVVVVYIEEIIEVSSVWLWDRVLMTKFESLISGYAWWSP